MNKFLRESEKGFDRIDTEAGVIYGVKVLGSKSRNGRIYEDAAIRRAVPMYEGVTVNLNHQRIESGSRAVPDRQIQDRWGVLRNARYAEGAVYADLHYLKNHPMTPQLIEAAERFPDTFGLSHDAAGDEQVIDGERRVIELFEIRSVDVVAEPATNNGLFECCRPSRSTSRLERKRSRLALLEVKDGDGDGKINDGKPSQAPAPKKTPMQSKLTKGDKIKRAERRAARYDKMANTLYDQMDQVLAQSYKAKGKEAEALRAKAKEIEKSAGKLQDKRFAVQQKIRKVTAVQKSPFEFAPNVPKEPYTPMAKNSQDKKATAPQKVSPAEQPNAVQSVSSVTKKQAKAELNKIQSRKKQIDDELSNIESDLEAKFRKLKGDKFTWRDMQREWEANEKVKSLEAEESSIIKRELDLVKQIKGASLTSKDLAKLAKASSKAQANTKLIAPKQPKAVKTEPSSGIEEPEEQRDPYMAKYTKSDRSRSGRSPFGPG